MIEVLHRKDIPLGGFSGLKEHRLVMNPKLFGQNPVQGLGMASVI